MKFRLLAAQKGGFGEFLGLVGVASAAGCELLRAGGDGLEMGFERGHLLLDVVRVHAKEKHPSFINQTVRALLRERSFNTGLDIVVRRKMGLLRRAQRRPRRSAPKARRRGNGKFQNVGIVPETEGFQIYADLNKVPVCEQPNQCCCYTLNLHIRANRLCGKFKCPPTVRSFIVDT